MARKKSRKNSKSLWWKGDPVFGVSVPPRRTQYDQVEGQFGPGLTGPAVNRRNRGRPKRRAKRSGLSLAQLKAGFGGAALKKAARAGKLTGYKSVSAGRSGRKSTSTGRKGATAKRYRREPAAFREWQRLGPQAMRAAHRRARSEGVKPRGARWSAILKAEMRKVSGKAGVRDRRAKGGRKGRKSTRGRKR